jgi:hypothetical protein
MRWEMAMEPWQEEGTSLIRSDRKQNGHLKSQILKEDFWLEKYDKEEKNGLDEPSLSKYNC